MSSLLPKTVSQVELALEAACEMAFDLSVNLRDLWDPKKCPVQFLPHLASASSVDRWDSGWSVATKRSVISAAWGAHNRKGTVKSLEDVIGAFGADAVVAEWWQTVPRGVPHSFEVIVYGGVGTVAVQSDLVASINAVKPMRSSVVVGFGAVGEAAINVISGGVFMHYQRYSCGSRV